jgi:hypothetical protein
MKDYAPLNLVTSIAYLQIKYFQCLSTSYLKRTSANNQNKNDGCPLVHKVMQLLKDTDWTDFFIALVTHTHTQTGRFI